MNVELHLEANFNSAWKLFSPNENIKSNHSHCSFSGIVISSQTLLERNRISSLTSMYRKTNWSKSYWKCWGLLILFPVGSPLTGGPAGFPADLQKIKHNSTEGSLFSSIELFKYLLKWENKADTSAAAWTRTKTTPAKTLDSLSSTADLPQPSCKICTWKVTLCRSHRAKMVTGSSRFCRFTHQSEHNFVREAEAVQDGRTNEDFVKSKQKNGWECQMRQTKKKDMDKLTCHLMMM